MRRKFILSLTITALAAAGAWAAGWGDMLKGAAKTISGGSGPKKANSSAAVRGLGEEEAPSKDTGGDSVTDKREYGLLDRLDKKVPSDSDVDAFIKEGGLEK